MWQYFISTHRSILTKWCRPTGFISSGFLIIKDSSLLGCYSYRMINIWIRFERAWCRHRQEKAVLPDPGEEGTTLLRSVRKHLRIASERLNLHKKTQQQSLVSVILKFFQQPRASGQIWGIILIGAVKSLTLYAPCIILQYVYKPTRCTKFL